MVDAKENPPPSSILWPQFYDLKSTRKAAMAGFWTALAISVIGILFSFYIFAQAGLTKILVVYVVSSIVMGLIAFGTLKMSRIAAYIALIVAIFKAIQDLIFFNIIGLPFSFIFLFLFIYSARGVRYYHRLKTGKEVQIQLHSRKRVRNTVRILKRVLVISTIFILVLYFLGIHSIYEVDLDVEAIITQNGKIIGEPKKPGLHIKVPFIQEVHFINVKSYNWLSLNIPEADSINAEIVWHVNDSKKFFEATKYENIDKIFDTQILSILNKIGSSSDKNVLIDIAEAQKRNANYSNALIERLIVDIQEPIRPYGIGIVHILIKKNHYS